MKKSILILFIFASATACFGQSLFFDNLNNSTWKSESYYNDSTIRIIKEIGLAKVTHSLDSLKVNVTIWTFRDGSLTIKYYDCHLKKDSLVTTCNYQVNADKGVLKIILKDNTTLEYKAGIVSTGGYVLLMRKKDKIKK